MEHRLFPTETVRVAGDTGEVRDGERVTILQTADADVPGYLVETWDGRRVRVAEPHLVAIADTSEDDWDAQADQTVQDDWTQQADQTQP